MSQPASTPTYSLPAKLERFDGLFAIFSNEKTGEFRWPIKNLPENVHIGETILFKISTPETEQKTGEEEKYSRMRKLLEELIN